MRESSSICVFCTQRVNDSFVREPAQELSVALCLVWDVTLLSSSCHGFVEVTTVPHAVFLMQTTQIVGPSLMVSQFILKGSNSLEPSVVNQSK